MHTFEVEVKSLLSGKKHADEFVKRLKENDERFCLVSTSSQLNHYFQGGDVKKLSKEISAYLRHPEKPIIEAIAWEGKNHSVRTRKDNDNVILVLKAKRDGSDSTHGTVRIEFEAKISSLGIDDLDRIVLESGFSYQSKWSRKRDAYVFKDIQVSIDFNAGYGYLAEFEKSVSQPNNPDDTLALLRSELAALGLQELADDRLERMFVYYSEHWPEYYRTEKTFTIL